MAAKFDATEKTVDLGPAIVPAEEDDKEPKEGDRLVEGGAGGDGAPKPKKEKKSAVGNPVQKYVNVVKENKAFTACVVVDIVLIILIFAVTLAWLVFAQTEIVDFDPAPKMYCMKCEYAVDRAKYFPSPERDRPDECCASGEEKYLKARLKKKVEETLNIEYREKPLFQLCLNSTTAEHPKGYAQIRSVSQAVVSTANTNLYLIKWDYPPSNRDPDTFLEQVLYDNSNAFYQVKRAGYYHIYSNLVFDFPSNNSTNVTPAESVIRHLVLKYRKEYNVGEKFLEGYSTLCPNTGATTWNSFIFGNFYLETTDKVQVFVNNPHFLAIKSNSPGAIEKATSYFGMYLI